MYMHISGMYKEGNGSFSLYFSWNSTELMKQNESFLRTEPNAENGTEFVLERNGIYGTERICIKERNIWSVWSGRLAVSAGWPGQPGRPSRLARPAGPAGPAGPGRTGQAGQAGQQASVNGTRRILWNRLDHGTERNNLEWYTFDTYIYIYIDIYIIYI